MNVSVDIAMLHVSKSGVVDIIVTVIHSIQNMLTTNLAILKVLINSNGSSC